MQGAIAFMRCSWVNRGSALTVHSVTCDVTWSCRAFIEHFRRLARMAFPWQDKHRVVYRTDLSSLCQEVDHELEPLVIYIDFSNQAASKQMDQLQAFHTGSSLRGQWVL